MGKTRADRGRCGRIAGALSHGPTSDPDLDLIKSRSDAATPAPWWAWVEGRDGESGDSFIGQGGYPRQIKDLYLQHGHDEGRVTEADLDFIAHARQDVPLLLAEVRRLRPLLAT